MKYFLLALGVLLGGIALWQGVAAVPGHTARAAECPHQACAIQHVVVMIKENRTFDNMFGTFPHADGSTSYRDADGHIHPLIHEPDRLLYNISHDAQSATMAYDGGRMDRFSGIAGAHQLGSDEADSQLHAADIPNYWRYAEQFTLADRFFSTVMGPSFPNHLSMITSLSNATENPAPSGGFLGCDSPAGTLVDTVDSAGEHSPAFPCFNYRTVADLLDNAGRSWRYFGKPYQLHTTGGYLWSTFAAIKHIRNGPDWHRNVVDYTQFDRQAHRGTLPAVSWLVQPFEDSDHPGTSICAGENWTVRHINEIMSNRKAWNHT
ncbi:MAG: hypothetical protein M3Z66_21210, partial [Chloroflexota bacterium]|nr:hypothetical protein [Chloroflexota bacterium]